MPLVVRELIIRATIRSEPEPVATRPGLLKAQRREIVRECVDQVLEILREREER